MADRTNSHTIFLLLGFTVILLLCVGQLFKMVVTKLVIYLMHLHKQIIRLDFRTHIGQII